MPGVPKNRCGLGVWGLLRRRDDVGRSGRRWRPRRPGTVIARSPGRWAVTRAGAGLVAGVLPGGRGDQAFHPLDLCPRRRAGPDSPDRRCLLGCGFGGWGVGPVGGVVWRSDAGWCRISHRTRIRRLAAGVRLSGPLLLAQSGLRLNRHAATRIVRRLAKKAGITKAITPHSLRHSFITAALDAGVPLRDV